MVFDRGTIKWSSLMLPEHVKALREWQDNEKNPKARTPVFDEQQNETFDRMLQQSLKMRQLLSITFIENGGERTIRGIVTKINPIDATIVLYDQNANKHTVPVNRIIGMN